MFSAALRFKISWSDASISQVIRMLMKARFIQSGTSSLRCTLPTVACVKDITDDADARTN